MGLWGGGSGAFPSPCSWQGALGIAPFLLSRKGPRSRLRWALLRRPALNRMSHCWRKQLEIHREPLASGICRGGEAVAPGSCQLRPGVTPGGECRWGSCSCLVQDGWHFQAPGTPRDAPACSHSLEEGEEVSGDPLPSKPAPSTLRAPGLFDSQATTLFFLSPHLLRSPHKAGR